MATKLTLQFKDASGSNIRYSFNYADPEVDATDVKTLMQTMITNGSIYQKPPITIVSAKTVTTTETDIALPA